MTSRQLRNQRRAAERREQKLTRKIENQNASLSEGTRVPSDNQAAAPAPSTRAETNRANSQNSTGPRTQEGKLKSSQNSFKHGLYSKQLVLPTEDPAELDQLRASLRAEHQPVNTTEEMLVNEIAENFWRLRRMRELEARTLQPQDVSDLDRLLPIIQLIQRIMTSAERGFHKSLPTLRALQKDRGFVPQEDTHAAASSAEIGFVPQETTSATAGIGFVSKNACQPEPDSPFLQSPERSDRSFPSPETGFVSQNGQEELAEAA